MNYDTKDFYQSIFEQSSCLRKRQMLALLEDRLFPEEIRAVEIHLADCDLCIEALEGLKAVSKPIEEALKTIPLPNYPEVEIDNQIVFTPPSPVLDTYKPKAPKRPNFQWQWSASLTLLAFLIIGGVLIYFFEYKPNKNNTTPLLSNNNNDLDYIEKNNIEPDDLINSSVIKDIPEEVQNILSSTTEENAHSDDNTDDLVRDNKEVDNAIVTNEDLQKTEETKATIKREEPLKIEEKAKENIPAKTEVKKEETNVASKLKETTTDKEEKVASSPKTKDDDFNYAISFYENKSYGTALLYFQEVLKNKSHPRYSDALYYAALSQNALGRKSQVKELVKELKKHPNHNKYDLDAFD